MTPAQKPDALLVVAWLTTWNKDRVRGSGSLLSRVEPQPKYDCNQYDPIVRLSDAQAALQALAAEKDSEIAALKDDAARYRWLVQCKRVPWGAFLVDAHEVGIDAAIDSAIALAAKEAK
jgi:hypothetical protein